jgi:hypothetical protein
LKGELTSSLTLYRTITTHSPDGFINAIGMAQIVEKLLLVNPI